MPRSRSGSPASDRGARDRPDEFRVHIADLSPEAQESDIRKLFQKFGTIMDVWQARASCFAFVVYKHKKDAQAAIDEMDGRPHGSSRLKVTWARPRIRSRSGRYDPNMRCYQCGQRGHFSRDCGREMVSDGRPSSRREDDHGRYSSSSYSRRSRSRSPLLSQPPPPPPPYLRHGHPGYPPVGRRYNNNGFDNYYPPERSNGREHRYREPRGTRLTPPSASAKYNHRS